MATTIIDREGFVKDPHMWTMDMAQELATALGLGKLQMNHWRVIKYLRDHYLENRTLPVMKHVCHELDLDEGCISRLFRNPEVAWKVAGLPDPGEEAKSYMAASERPH